MEQFKVWKTVELGGPIIVKGDTGLWYGEYGKDPELGASSNFTTCDNDCKFAVTSKCKGNYDTCKHSVRYIVTKSSNGCYQRRYQNFNDAINEAGKKCCMCHSRNYAQKILLNPAFTVNANKQEIDLVYVHITDLGFSKRGANIKEIYDSAKKHGFELCPAEVGPRLYLKLRNDGWSWPEHFVTGMRPIKIDSAPHLFVMDKDSGNGVTTFFSLDNTFWEDCYFFVFALPRPLVKND